MTLSHCWGGQQPLTTTIHSLAQRKSGIPLNTLPALYRDAVTITRKLGVSYLWIDSLCIIQDSHEDWIAEATKMGDIYRNSHLTISALSAKDCHQQLLSERPSACNALKDAGGVKSKGEIFRTAPLLQRAWVVQERLLSSRILYYHVDEMFWECLAFTARESSHRIKPVARVHNDIYDCTPVKAPLVQALDPDPLFPISPPSDWHTIVAEYTRCQLTRPSDKLPALSGLASIFKRNTGYEYLAGLWKEDFVNGLLWFVPDFIPGPYFTVEYRGPSWSWVSTDLPVQNKVLSGGIEVPAGHEKIKLITSDIQLAGPDPMGGVLYATVTVQASFYKLEYEVQPGSRKCMVFDTAGGRFGKGILDSEDGEPAQLKPCAGICITQKQMTMFKSPMYITYFMIVVPAVGGGEEESWRRIGLCWANWDVPAVPELSLIKIV